MSFSTFASFVCRLIQPRFYFSAGLHPAGDPRDCKGASRLENYLALAKIKIFTLQKIIVIYFSSISAQIISIRNAQVYFVLLNQPHKCLTGWIHISPFKNILDATDNV